MDEPWMIEHRRLYGPDAVKRRAAAAQPPKEKPKFPGIPVSQLVVELVGAVERATSALIDPEMPQTEEAVAARYAHVCVCRKTLYEYLSKLEQKAGVVQERIIRF